MAYFGALKRRFIQRRSIGFLIRDGLSVIFCAIFFVMLQLQAITSDSNNANNLQPFNFVTFDGFNSKETAKLVSWIKSSDCDLQFTRIFHEIHNSGKLQQKRPLCEMIDAGRGKSVFDCWVCPIDSRYT